MDVLCNYVISQELREYLTLKDIYFLSKASEKLFLWQGLIFCPCCRRYLQNECDKCIIVRNMEDSLGPEFRPKDIIEGLAKWIDQSLERRWHNNSFYKGYCSEYQKGPLSPFFDTLIFRNGKDAEMENVYLDPEDFPQITVIMQVKKKKSGDIVKSYTNYFFEPIKIHDLVVFIHGFHAEEIQFCYGKAKKGILRIWKYYKN